MPRLRLHGYSCKRWCLSVWGINKHQFFWLFNLVVIDLRKACNDDQVPYCSASSCRAVDQAVDRVLAAASLALHRLGDKAFAVIDVPGVYLCIGHNASGVKRVFSAQCCCAMSHLQMRCIASNNAIHLNYPIRSKSTSRLTFHIASSNFLIVEYEACCSAAFFLNIGN